MTFLPWLAEFSEQLFAGLLPVYLNKAAHYFSFSFAVHFVCVCVDFISPKDTSLLVPDKNGMLFPFLLLSGMVVISVEDRVENIWLSQHE